MRSMNTAATANSTTRTCADSREAEANGAASDWSMVQQPVFSTSGCAPGRAQQPFISLPVYRQTMRVPANAVDCAATKRHSAMAAKAEIG